MLQARVSKVFVAALILSHVLLLGSAENIQDDDEAYVDNEVFDDPAPPVAQEPPVVEEEVLYATPPPPVSSYIAECFDDIVAFEKTWVRSQAKKDGVDADIAKYDGVWKVEESSTSLLKGDRGLVLKSKAKHAAISAPLSRPFKFGAKPFVVQYEVALQDGQECGGAYIKLLSAVDGKKMQLDQFQDKTPYTIMFGPDKCGNDYKLHFIFRHVNPLNGSIEEKHAKRPRDKLEESFKDKRPHLYTLVLRPDNTYEISLDHSIINSGHLLEDFTPPVNPEKEISDPNDRKPEDWDEKEKIPDPDDKKPEDWDDDAPKKIPDPNASIPSGWLEDEPEMIPDPEAVRPDDWDNDMDGEWEAPLINNPACSGAPGCGPWTRPAIDNPAYKGKWRPRLIDNPNYRGQWVPRMIANPNYFQDLEPFKMTPINAVGFEIWSMSENIYFDNVLITDSISDARQFAQETFDLKLNKLDRGKGGMIQQLLDYSNDRPWLYAIYVLIAAVPVVLIIMCCCTGSSEKSSGESQKDRKKTDSPTEDDPVQEPEQGEEEEEEDSKKEAEKSSQEEDEDDEDEEEEEEEEENDGEEENQEEKDGEKQAEEENDLAETKQSEEETASGSSPRPRRRARKD